MANSVMDAAGKSVRRTFDMAAKWKFTGVTREDIQSQNPSGLRAIETYGECSEPILLKTKRAKISPEIREKPKAVEITIKKKQNTETTESLMAEDKTELEKEGVGADSLFGMG